ncbi:uncharacterized protein N7446_005108 [Penicillium canescens]|uniref:uncharacterized protein n=1 Tax=Penicillium canescens TaxID=5083 RepID=UPI0026DECABA|nr:uncharacterized protein N7446_005108 [Penicillium canescens]KAJ6068071.1 hypothetical protein N7446_005108 [Penicillium canescens]
MPLDNATSGLTGQLPVNQSVNQVQSTASGAKKNVKPRKLNQTTKDLTEPVVPGEYPSDDAPPKKEEVDSDVSFSGMWATIVSCVSSLFPQAFDAFESWIRYMVSWLLPPPRQAAIYEAALKRPAATTFIICQMICCGVPLLIFLAGVFVFAAVSILLWAILSLLILGPVLLVTSMMGISLWGWGWVFYGLVKWVDQRFLGGMISRFWIPRTQEGDKGEGGEEQSEGEKNDE